MSVVPVVKPLGGGGTEPITGTYDGYSNRTLTIPADARFVLLYNAYCKNGNVTVGISGVIERGKTSFLLAENCNGKITMRTASVSWTDTTVTLPQLSYFEYGYYGYYLACNYAIV